MLDRQVVVAEFLAHLVGGVEGGAQAVAHLGAAGGALEPRLALEGGGHRGLEPADVGAGLLEDRGGDPPLLLEQREQQVRALQFRVPRLGGQPLRGLQRLLQLGGDLVQSHGVAPI